MIHIIIPVFNEEESLYDLISDLLKTSKDFNEKKLIEISKRYLELKKSKITSNYFDKNFGGKFFSSNDAKIIGFLRDKIIVQKEVQISFDLF